PAVTGSVPPGTAPGGGTQRGEAAGPLPGPRASEQSRPAGRATRTPPVPRPSRDGPVWTTSLIPYTYALLDERSGYPAGIRDPEWQHMVLDAAGDPAALEEALTRAAVRICAELRGLGHPSGPADAREIARLAGDLARLRGLPAA
ncbi:DUF5682 family protein, partial [Streptomyces halstedii]|uniref:DUF5682 family protein n=1 Tax=Streptomyces halstedii TaxID=1944 RepID=UPI0039C1F2A9